MERDSVTIYSYSNVIRVWYQVLQVHGQTMYYYMISHIFISLLINE